MIISVHITHMSAGVDRLSDITPVMEKNIEKYLGNVLNRNEYVVLKTCNRFEIYFGTDDIAAVKESLETFVKNTIPQSQDSDLSFILTGKDSVRHLMRVSCGLDSLIVGEDQIQGQVREAYVKAKAEGHVKRSLTHLFDKTLAVGRKVRAETALGEGALSVGSAAVELAEQKLNGLKGKTVTILGAGDMGEIIANNLAEKGLKMILISSRTYDHAVEIAKKTNGTAFSKDYLESAMKESDALFVATSAPHTLIHKEEVQRARIGITLPFLIIDVSAPRNVDDDVKEIPSIELATMEGLHEIAFDNAAKRHMKIKQAEKIVNEELEKIDRERRELAAELAIKSINKKISGIRDEELIKAKNIARSSDADTVFDDFSKVLISRIMADTYDKLREASREGRDDICDIATDLFGVELPCSRKQE